MADIVDDADKQAQYHLDAAIRNAKHNANFSIEGTGICQYCGEIVKPVQVKGQSIIGRWCSATCRDSDD